MTRSYSKVLSGKVQAFFADIDSNKYLGTHHCGCSFLGLLLPGHGTCKRSHGRSDGFLHLVLGILKASFGT